MVTERLWEVLAGVVDPELPFLTIEDLGVLRAVAVEEDGRVTVTITPTYSGCPAIDAIRASILDTLAGAGHPAARVRTEFSPAWSTDDITEAGRMKLAAHGIAPPRASGTVLTAPIHCPRCRHDSTHILSEFGSTACKALLVCDSCGEPFDHFKELL